jgi:Rps23 Pro-64 3,4-dihydroxylase Tpa1-like proline 4-hydroxylase
MTAREMIDSLSGTLVCDDRILSVPERELLINLLHRTRAQSSVPENAIAETITRIVGEIVNERAFAVLGQSMTRQLLQQQLTSSLRFADRSSDHDMPVIRAGTPVPPSPAPAPGSAPRPPNTSVRAGTPVPPSPAPVPGSAPRPPNTSVRAGTPVPPSPAPAPGSAPRPPNTSSQPNTGGVAVLEASDYISAECVVLDEFLTAPELHTLRQYVLEQEMRFELSEVLSPGVTGGAVDYEHRRSRVLMDLGGHESMIVDRVLTCLPRVLQKWGRDPFPISRVETQATASNHGDFFRCHSDNGAEAVATREITFVYFFHHEPKQFSGGELRIYDSRRENDNYVPTSNYRTIIPEQNQLVLFASGLSHEITPVDCPSGQFADSRFTLNGWVHR